MPVQTRSMLKKQSTSVSNVIQEIIEPTIPMPETIQEIIETPKTPIPISETIQEIIKTCTQVPNISHEVSKDKERLRRYSKYSSSVLEFIYLVLLLKNETTIKVTEDIANCMSLLTEPDMNLVHLKMRFIYNQVSLNIRLLSEDNKIKAMVIFCKMICPILSVMMVMMDFSFRNITIEPLVKNTWNETFVLQRVSLPSLRDDMINKVNEEMTELRRNILKMVQENPTYLHTGLLFGV
jgi:hypothetical protein